MWPLPCDVSGGCIDLAENRLAEMLAKQKKGAISSSKTSTFNAFAETDESALKSMGGAVQNVASRDDSILR